MRIAVSTNGFYIYVRVSEGGPISAVVRTLELRPSEAYELLRQLSFVLTKDAQRDQEERDERELGEGEADVRPHRRQLCNGSCTRCV